MCNVLTPLERLQQRKERLQANQDKFLGREPKPRPEPLVRQREPLQRIFTDATSRVLSVGDSILYTSRDDYIHMTTRSYEAYIQPFNDWFKKIDKVPKYKEEPKILEYDPAQQGDTEDDV